MVKIGIAGAGGIGSNVAMNLVRSGIKNLKIVDFDKIDNSNLNRQFYFEDQVEKVKVEALEINLKRISEDIRLEVINKKIENENIMETFKDCDIVVEGFDKKIYKSLFLEKLHNKKLLVMANGIAGLDIGSIKVKEIGENIKIVGDFKRDIAEYKTYSPKVQIVAATMANLILSYLDNNKEHHE